MNNPKLMEALNVLRDEHPDLVDGALDEIETLVAKRAGSWRDAESMFTLIPNLLDDKPIGDGVIVGWTHCGSCMKHIRHCDCPSGPAVPKHIAEWADKWFTRTDGFGRQTAVQDRKPSAGPRGKSGIDIGDLVTPDLVAAVKEHAAKPTDRYVVVRHSDRVTVVDLYVDGPRGQQQVVEEYTLEDEAEAEAEAERLNAGDS